MKPIAIITLFIGLSVGFWTGSFFAGQRARIAVLSGPYSDNFGPARTELDHAMTKLRSGNTNVIEHLTAADGQIEKAQQWSRRFMGMNDGDKQ